MMYGFRRDYWSECVRNMRGIYEVGSLQSWKFCLFLMVFIGSEGDSGPHECE